MNALFDKWQQVLAAQPFSVFIGAELAGTGDGRVELRLSIGEHHKQNFGFVHGGVISYLADNALTFAGATKLGVPGVTVEMKINYIRPAIGDYLIARAEALSGGRSQSVTRCDVFVVSKGEEKLCAAAQATIVSLPKPS